jgi:hypothetical protein
MDHDDTTSRRRLKVAGIVAAAVLAVPGGMVISNAFASDAGSPSSSPTAVPVQSDGYPQPYGDAAPPQDRGGTPGDRGDCPPGQGHGPGRGDGNGSGNGSGSQGSTDSTGYTLQ